MTGRKKHAAPLKTGSLKLHKASVVSATGILPIYKQ
jgi:hypothetical protein